MRTTYPLRRIWVFSPVAPGPHKVILWWTDQPRVDSCQYLKARGLMQADGKLHSQIVRLYTEEDDIDWGDQGLDELIRITTAKPGRSCSRIPSTPTSGAFTAQTKTPVSVVL